MSCPAFTTDNVFKYLEKTAGRDKLMRTVQYFAKFLAYQLKQGGSDKDTISRVTKLSSTLSSSRKLFRLGKFAESYLKGYKEATSKDLAKWDVPHAVSVAKNFSTGFYLLFDTLQWLHEQNLHRGSELQFLKDRRNYWWFAQIVFGLLSAWFKYSSLSKKHAAIKSDQQKRFSGASPAPAEAKDADKEAQKALAKIEDEKTDQVLEMVKNAADFTLPLTQLKYMEMNDGLVGLLGTLSSAIGVYAAWKK